MTRIVSEASKKEEKELRERVTRGLAGSIGFVHAIDKASLGRIRPKQGRTGKHLVIIEIFCNFGPVPNAAENNDRQGVRRPSARRSQQRRGRYGDHRFRHGVRGTIKHPNRATMIIPTRLFLHPVIEKYHEQILNDYREVIRSSL